MLPLCLVALAPTVGQAQPIDRLEHARTRKAIVTAGAQLSWWPEGTGIQAPLAADTEVAIHKERVGRQGRTAITVLVDRAVLQMYVDPGALAAHVEAGTMLFARPGAKRGDPNAEGAWVARGARIRSTVDATDGSKRVALEIPFHGYTLALDGLVPTSRIGTSYLGEWVADETERPFVPDARIAATSRLLDAPRGRPFAVFRGAGTIDVMTLERRRGDALVRTRDGTVGWIRRSAVKPAPRSVSAAGHGGFLSTDSFVAEIGLHQATLPQGTPLYDAIEGKQVGVIGWRFERQHAAEHAGWRRYDLTSGVGIVQVWARPSQ